MITYKNLFQEIYSFENLYLAAKKAKKAKKETLVMSQFHFHLEDELLQIRSELKEKTYVPGKYRSFIIKDPKTRMISAAPYRDRVVHHALCNVIEPIIDRTFIYDTYANRLDKGAHKAIIRYQQFAQQHRYVLKCDIRKFFPSIDHKILKQCLRRKISCQNTLWLIDLIIDHSNPQEPHEILFPGDDLFTPQLRKEGLPIGNLTSQFWGNVYLNQFDHFVKETLCVPAYIRYVDDFVLLGNDKAQMRSWLRSIHIYLQSLRLILHPYKTKIYETRVGIPFLGFQVFPRYRYVRKEKVWRYRRHLRNQIKQVKNHQKSSSDMIPGINSWLGHVRFGQSNRLENQTFAYLRSQGLDLYQRTSGSWGLVEQQ